MIFSTTLATLLIVSMTSLASAQYPYADPYAAQVQARDVRQAQLANQRTRAAVPVNYTFPVRRDLSGVYGAGAYSSVYGAAKCVLRRGRPRGIPPRGQLRERLRRSV